MHIIDETIRFLEDSRDLISDKEQWCKDNFAEFLSYNQSGISTYSNNSKACRWCAIGAMIKTFADRYNDKYSLIKSKASFGDADFAVQAIDDDLVFSTAIAFLGNVVEKNKFFTNYQKVYRFNDRDETTHKDVIEAFDNAILYLKKQKDSLDRKESQYGEFQ